MHYDALNKYLIQELRKLCEESTAFQWEVSWMWERFGLSFEFWSVCMVVLEQSLKFLNGMHHCHHFLYDFSYVLIGLWLCRFPAWSRDGTPLPNSMSILLEADRAEAEKCQRLRLADLVGVWEGVGAKRLTRSSWSSRFCCSVQLISCFFLACIFLAGHPLSYRILQDSEDLTIHHHYIRCNAP